MYATDWGTETVGMTDGELDVAATVFERGGDGDPNLIISQFFASWGVRDYSGYSSPRLDYVLSNGLKATALQARTVDYRVAQKILLTDRPGIFLVNAVTLAAFSTSLRGVQLLANGLLDVENAQYN
jgi:ABC-type transport system substrate-binding protein